MKEKNLVLFIYEVALLKDIEFLYTNRENEIIYNFNEDVLDYAFVRQLNCFIEQKYTQNKKQFSCIFDTNLLEKFITKNYEILDLNVLSRILSKYRNMDNYIKLVTSIEPKIQQDINELAIKFIIFYKELLDLHYQEPNGICKILLQ